MNKKPLIVFGREGTGHHGFQALLGVTDEDKESGMYYDNSFPSGLDREFPAPELYRSTGDQTVLIVLDRHPAISFSSILPRVSGTEKLDFRSGFRSEIRLHREANSRIMEAVGHRFPIVVQYDRLFRSGYRHLLKNIIGWELHPDNLVHPQPFEDREIIKRYGSMITDAFGYPEGRI